MQAGARRGLSGQEDCVQGSDAISGRGGGPAASGVTSADIELSWNIDSLKIYSLPMTRENSTKKWLASIVALLFVSKHS